MSDALVPYRRELPEAPADLEESLSGAFSVWETRGRGWQLFSFPVDLEPPLCPLYALLSMPELSITDDGRTQGFWSRLFSGADEAASNQNALAKYQNEVAEYYETISKANDPEFCSYYNHEFTEFRLLLSKDFKPGRQAAENLLLSFSYLLHPVSFEIIGCEREIVVQFACSEVDAAQIRQQIKTHLPNVRIKESCDYLSDEWINGGNESIVADFGLAEDFFMPLKTGANFDADFLVTVLAALSDLEENEIGVFQILFHKCRKNWAEEIISSVSYLEEDGTFHKSQGKLRAAKEKTKSPLFAAAIRVAGRSYEKHRAWHIVKGLGAALASFSDPSGNELIPLSNDDFDEYYREQSLINRHSYRNGTILNAEELAAIAHPPSGSIYSEKLFPALERTKPLPKLAIGNKLLLGENAHEGDAYEASLSNEQRTRHLLVLGGTGSGKSNLFLNLIRQDAENKQGLCVIDPHGDLIDEVIAQMPEERIKDVVLFDPADSEFPIGFNILSAKSELEKTLLSSDLASAFRRMSTSWGDVMDSVLANAILAFVESKRGGSLFDLKRFLVEKDFRAEFLTTVEDDAVRYFWTNEFPHLTGKPQSSILIRLDAFLRQKLIRNIVCQKENKIDFRDVMDSRKILLVKLSQGLIGEENAQLLGTMIVSKLHQTAFSRQNAEHRPFFAIYIDEFQHFVAPSMENLLSGIRKFGVGLHLAAQGLQQIQSRNTEVAASVLANCYSRICFRMGDQDAGKIASGFSFFNADDLQNLGIGEAIARIERAEFDFNLQTFRAPKVESSVAEEKKAQILAHSRQTYAKPKSEVEAELFIPKTVLPEEKATVETAKKPVEKKSPTTSTPKLEAIPHIEQTVSDESSVKTSKPEIIASPSKASVPMGSSSDKDPHGHRYLQLLVKRMAESKGFLATLEKEVLGGAGRIDVALESNSQKIACEISVTNEADYEVQNIRKCFSAGFSPVLLLSADRKHLEKIRRKSESELSDDDFSNTKFLTPEEFHSWLENVEIESDDKTEKIKGFKVKVKLKPVDETGVSTRKRAISDVIFGGLKKLKNKSKDK